MGLRLLADPLTYVVGLLVGVGLLVMGSFVSCALSEFIVRVSAWAYTSDPALRVRRREEWLADIANMSPVERPAHAGSFLWLGVRGLTVRVLRAHQDVGPSSVFALAALPEAVEGPINVRQVREIASAGFPLWEPVDVMVRRNRSITLAYADLSRALARAIAAGDRPLDANWCTFATWWTKTIVESVENVRDDAAATLEASGEGSAQATLRLTAGSFRALAAANRVVFLEVGQSVAAFLQHFPTRVDDVDRDDRWRAFWARVELDIDDACALDPSWLLNPMARPDELRLGLRQYFEAMHTDDHELRSQHVLAGNLLLAAYEQRRFDGYVWAALALFSERAMRRLIRDRTGRVGGPRRLPIGLLALVMTRRMRLLLPDGEVLRISRSVPPARAATDGWPALATNAGATLPLLQVLITRYELAGTGRSAKGSRNWTSFDDRMRTMGNLFRSRQRQASLFDDPWSR